MNGRNCRKDRINSKPKALHATVFILLIALLLSGLLSAQDRSRKEIQYTLIPFVTIDDRTTIEFFIEEFFLPETSFTRIEVIDTENNGFGKSDLLKIYPSGNIYYLDMVTDTAQSVMNRWEMEENIEIITDHLDPKEYDKIQTAEYGILSSLAKGVERNYKDYPININMRRDSTGIVFEMWGYNADSLKYTPPPPPVPDSIRVYDLFHASRKEEIYLPDTTMYDIFFIYRREADTVYLGDEELEL